VSYDAAEHEQVWALEFEQYPGLIVRVRRPGFAAARTLARADRVLAEPSVDPVRRMDALVDIFGALADSMESWTLTRRGRPVSTTRAAVLACDGLMLGRIVGAWRTHVLGQHAPRQRPERVTGDEQPVWSDRLLRDLPMEPLVPESAADGDVEPEPGAEEPEDCGVALSLDPDIAAAQKRAWAEAEPDGGALHGGPEVVRAVTSA
jgi:hypothetical protein